MKHLWLIPIITALVFISGCGEEKTVSPGEENASGEEAEKQDPSTVDSGIEDPGKTGSVDIDLTEYVSEDRIVTIEIDHYLVNDQIPKEVGTFFSPEKNEDVNQAGKGQDNGSSIYFESSQIALPGEEVYYVALFITISSIEEGFLKIPPGMDDEQPVLITREGKSYERIITQFKYTGPADQYSGSNDLPPGSKGMIVFAYPAMEKPEEIDYIYFLKQKDVPGIEESRIVVPLNPLTNN